MLRKEGEMRVTIPPTEKADLHQPILSRYVVNKVIGTRPKWKRAHALSNCHGRQFSGLVEFADRNLGIIHCVTIYTNVKNNTSCTNTQRSTSHLPTHTATTLPTHAQF